MKVPARILLVIVFVVLASLFYLTASSARTRSINTQSAPVNLNGSHSTVNTGNETGRPLPPVIESPEPPAAGNAGPMGYPPPPPPGYPPPGTATPIPGLRLLLPVIMRR